MCVQTLGGDHGLRLLGLGRAQLRIQFALHLPAQEKGFAGIVDFGQPERRSFRSALDTFPRVRHFSWKQGVLRLLSNFTPISYDTYTSQKPVSLCLISILLKKSVSWTVIVLVLDFAGVFEDEDDHDNENEGAESTSSAESETGMRPSVAGCPMWF